MSMNASPKPIYVYTFVKNNHDTLSYAFTISSLITILDDIPLFLMLVTISCVNNMFSTMLFPFTNPAWFGDISVGRRSTNLSCSTLEIILFEKLLKLIGLMSENVATFFFLGTNTRLVSAINLGRSDPQKKALTVSSISSHIMSQQE